MKPRSSVVKRSRHGLARGFALLLASCVPGLGNVEYAVVNLPPPPGYDSLAVRDINDAGQVTGDLYQFQPPDMPQFLHRGFLWQAGVLHELPELPGYRSASTREINQDGTIMGYVYLTNSSSPGSITVKWGEGGVTNMAPSHDDGLYAFEGAINDSGSIAGAWTAAGGRIETAFAVIDSRFIDLGTLGSASFATGMNDSNVVVGSSWSFSANSWRAFLWSQGTGMVTLDALADKPGLGTAHAINNQGMIIGRRWTNGLDRAYCYFHGSVTDLGALGGTNSSPCDLNDSGVVVGTSDTSATVAGRAVAHAFVYTPARGMRDLNELIAKNSGWVLSTATAVNNYGQIIGSGSLNGQSCSFLLQPIPGITLARTNGLVTLSLSNLVPRTTYVIQRSELLQPSAWEDVIEILADAHTFTWSEAFYGNCKQVFYRVVST